MARITKVTVLDDIDGTESDDVREVLFSIDGRTYAIDLAPWNLQALNTALEPFLNAARPVTETRTEAPRRSPVRVVQHRHGGATPAKIRAWAAANGIEVSARGRLNSKVVEQYHTANAG